MSLRRGARHPPLSHKRGRRRYTSLWQTCGQWRPAQNMSDRVTLQEGGPEKKQWEAKRAGVGVHQQGVMGRQSRWVPLQEIPSGLVHGGMVYR